MRVTLREATEKDVPFIFSAWLKSFRNNPWVKTAPNPVYYKYQHELIERLLSRSSVVVACSEEDSDQILGFMVFEERGGCNVVHYVYVKQPYRKLQIASQLLSVPQRIDFYSHCNGKIHPKLKDSGAVYHPYLLFL